MEMKILAAIAIVVALVAATGIARTYWQERRRRPSAARADNEESSNIF